MTPDEITDRMEIEDLLQRYTHAIDTKDWELLDTVFTPDAAIDYTTSGGIAGKYPEVRAWLAEALAGFTMTQHMIGKTTMHRSEAGYECSSIFHNPMGSPAAVDGTPDSEGSHLSLFTVGGWYHDTCVKTADGWRIAAKFEQQAYMLHQGVASGPLPRGG